MRDWALAASILALAGATVWSWRDQPAHPTAVSHVDEQAQAGQASPAALLVDFRDDASDEALTALGLHRQPISRFSAADRLYRVEFASPAEAEAAASRLRQDPLVESVDYDASATLFPMETGPSAAPAPVECGPAKGSDLAKGFPNDPCFRYQWNLRQIGLPNAWKEGRGDGVVVAVIDTGVTRVPDLASTRLVPGYNFVADNEQTDDDHGHGTHVAGTIAQSTNNSEGVAGVAFGAAIMPLKVLSARGAGSMAAISQAIRFAADHGANVINLSLGGAFPVTPMRRAIDYARRKGVVVVAAAGNDGRGRVSYPARYPGVVAVAATQPDEKTTFYSNWGPEIDIAAPGGNTRVDQNGDGQPDGVLQNTIVPGASNGYLWFMGTSMASPHVAGVAALVMSAGVTRVESVESVLLGTARRPAAGGDERSSKDRVDDHVGAGIVDAQAAIKKAKLSRGASSLTLALVMTALGLRTSRRRLSIGGSHAWALAGMVLMGASGFFVMPSLGAPQWLSATPLGLGITQSLACALGPNGQQNPLVWSALIPLAGLGALYGVRKLRPALAGLAFGTAGALLFVCLAHTAHLHYLPGILDRLWLAGNAAICVALGALALRR